MSKQRTTRTLSLCLAAAMVAPAGLLPLARTARAADTPAAGGAAVAKEGKAQKTELNDKMEEMDEALKKLRRTIRSPEQNKESLELITKIEQGALACKGMTPAKAATVPEAERAKFVNAYRKQMADLIVALCQMESAILDGSNDKAQEVYKNIKGIEDKGHEQFTQDEGKEKK